MAEKTFECAVLYTLMVHSLTYRVTILNTAWGNILKNCEKLHESFNFFGTY